MMQFPLVAVSVLLYELIAGSCLYLATYQPAGSGERPYYIRRAIMFGVGGFLLGSLYWFI